MSVPMIKVLLVDDHSLFTDGLIALLRYFKTIEVVGQATRGLEAIEKIKTHQPDVVLLDHEMPDIKGTAVMEQLKNEPHKPRFIVLSFHCDEGHYVQKFIECGAAGCLTKSAEPHEVVNAIESVMQSGVYFEQTTQLALIQYLANEKLLHHNHKELLPFSAEEKKVILDAMREMNNKEIAKDIHKSTRTVEDIRSAMIARVGGKTMMCVVVYALIHKIIPEEELPLKN